jgi:hypothetical protein
MSRLFHRASLTLAAAAALPGCAIEPGPQPRSHETPSPQTRIDELPQPGSIITLSREKPGRIVCPHCSAENRMGETHCSRCSRRLSKEPVWVACPLCADRKGSPGEDRCPQCGGRGWVISAEETQEERPAEDEARTVPADPDGAPR